MKTLLRFSPPTFLVCGFVLLILACSTWAAGQTETVLHQFGQPHDGITPVAGLVFDSAGNLYGTTMQGGLGAGTVFELRPVKGGGWAYRTIYRFKSLAGDGQYPEAGLVLDASGNLYGTTFRGGAHDDGVVFELSPTKSRSWKETILYQFAGGSDGRWPFSALIFDAAGNLYGTTELGGTNEQGTVFELSPVQGGGWTETVLHRFTGGDDGYAPLPGLASDNSGNLYGTTIQGGLGNGTLFKLSPIQGGGWAYSMEHAFAQVRAPFTGVISAANGNLYGSTLSAVFELSPAHGTGWDETILYSFGQFNGDGSDCEAGLVMDADGLLYGTTQKGGTQDLGTVFKLSPAPGAGWVETVLFSFNRHDGAYPLAPLVRDAAGNLYGTTHFGGLLKRGNVFALAP